MLIHVHASWVVCRRAEALLKKMTLDEKFVMLHGPTTKPTNQCNTSVTCAYVGEPTLPQNYIASTHSVPLHRVVYGGLGMCVCVCVYIYACMRACVGVCVRRRSAGHGTFSDVLRWTLCASRVLRDLEHAL